MTKTKADFFDQPYFGECKHLLSGIGTWPLLDNSVARRRVLICAILMWSHFALEGTINSENIHDIMRYVSSIVGQAGQLLILSIPGQRMLNHSNQVFESTYASYWYNYSMRTKQLIRLLLLRSVTPCCFTAGKIFILSMESYLAMIRACMSYFAFISSV